MQTITITIKSANPPNIVVKERKSQRQNIIAKLKQLLAEADSNQKRVTSLAGKG